MGPALVLVTVAGLLAVAVAYADHPKTRARRLLVVSLLLVTVAFTYGLLAPPCCGAP